MKRKNGFWSLIVIQIVILLIVLGFFIYNNSSVKKMDEKIDSISNTHMNIYECINNSKITGITNSKGEYIVQDSDLINFQSNYYLLYQYIDDILEKNSQNYQYILQHTSTIIAVLMAFVALIYISINITTQYELRESIKEDKRQIEEISTILDKFKKNNIAIHPNNLISLIQILANKDILSYYTNDDKEFQKYIGKYLNYINSELNSIIENYDNYELNILADRMTLFQEIFMNFRIHLDSFQLLNEIENINEFNFSKDKIQKDELNKLKMKIKEFISKLECDKG